MDVETGVEIETLTTTEVEQVSNNSEKSSWKKREGGCEEESVKRV